MTPYGCIGCACGWLCDSDSIHCKKCGRQVVQVAPPPPWPSHPHQRQTFFSGAAPPDGGTRSERKGERSRQRARPPKHVRDQLKKESDGRDAQQRRDPASGRPARESSSRNRRRSPASVDEERAAQTSGNKSKPAASASPGKREVGFEGDDSKSRPPCMHAGSSGDAPAANGQRSSPPTETCTPDQLYKAMVAMESALGVDDPCAVMARNRWKAAKLQRQLQRERNQSLELQLAGQARAVDEAEEALDKAKATRDKCVDKIKAAKAELSKAEDTIQQCRRALHSAKELYAQGARRVASKGGLEEETASLFGAAGMDIPAMPVQASAQLRALMAEVHSGMVRLRRDAAREYDEERAKAQDCDGDSVMMAADMCQEQGVNPPGNSTGVSGSGGIMADANANPGAGPPVEGTSGGTVQQEGIPLVLATPVETPRATPVATPASTPRGRTARATATAQTSILEQPAIKKACVDGDPGVGGSSS